MSRKTALHTPELPEERDDAPESLDERRVRHMIEDVTRELQKLDEGLRVVSAYLARLREQSEKPEHATLH